MFGFTPAWWWAQHRRRSLALTYDASQTVSVGTAVETDTAPAVAAQYPQTISVGTAVETDTGESITAAGTGTRAQGGLAFLFSQGAGSLNQTVTVGTATETNTARPITVPAAQTIAVGTAVETNTARPIVPAISQTVSVGTAVEYDYAVTIVNVSGATVVHPQGMVPGTSIGAYRRWEWKGPVAAKLNAGPGAAVATTTVADDLTATFYLAVGEYVAYSPAYPTKRLFFMVTE